MLTKTKQIPPESKLSMCLGREVGSASTGEQTLHFRENEIVLFRMGLGRNIGREKEYRERTESDKI